MPEPQVPANPAILQSILQFCSQTCTPAAGLSCTPHHTAREIVWASQNNALCFFKPERLSTGVHSETPGHALALFGLYLQVPRICHWLLWDISSAKPASRLTPLPKSYKNPSPPGADGVTVKCACKLQHPQVCRTRLEGKDARTLSMYPGHPPICLIRLCKVAES